ncbi:MAG: aldehyde dehydrogenase family protein [Pseudomonadota bacterium]
MNEAIDRPVTQYINGAWTAQPAAEALEASRDPATGHVLGRYEPGSEELTDAAVAAARSAFDNGAWAQSPRLRERVLLELADRMEARKDELIDLIRRENGKLLGEATFEVLTSISECRFYAGLTRSTFGRSLESEPDTWSLLLREPAGVCAVIVPWNAPVILLVRSLAPALAAGCTAVVKPAPQTPLANAWIIDCLSEIEALPAGVVNSVNESGAVVGKRLVDDPQVDVISFTGSSATGKHIMASASKTLKRLSLELGGKAPAIVFPDADFQKALPQLVRWSTVMAGQMCIAITRILVHDDVYDQYASALSEAYASLRIKASMSPDSQMGPLIDKANQSRVLGLIDAAEAQGKILLRGDAMAGEHPDGCFVSPTLVAMDDLSKPLVQEEVFGPILTIERFNSEEEAIAQANATRYGLAASLWTLDLNRALRVSRRVRSGTVWLNSHGRLIAEAETGGYGESGLGRLHGIEALNDFLETKHVYLEAGEN